MANKRLISWTTSVWRRRKHAESIRPSHPSTTLTNDILTSIKADPATLHAPPPPEPHGRPHYSAVPHTSTLIRHHKSNQSRHRTTSLSRGVTNSQKEQGKDDITKLQDEEEQGSI